MSYAVRFLPEVEADILNGRLWYEEKAAGLGDEFLRVFYACSSDLARDPMTEQNVHGDFQRRLLRRFPCAVYFRVEDDLVIVFGLFHCARDPRRPHQEPGGRQPQK